MPQKFRINSRRSRRTSWYSQAGLSTIRNRQDNAVSKDDIENGIVNGLVAEPINPNTDFVEEVIVGESFIKPKLQYEYTYIGNVIGEWHVDSELPI